MSHSKASAQLSWVRSRENRLVDDGVELRGTLYDGAGQSIADGVVELWDPEGRRWGRCGTDAHGHFSFVVEEPHGRAGAAPHLHVYVFARGLLRHQLTRVYFPDEAHDHDPVLATLPEEARASLVAVEDDGALRFDIHMQGERATVFFAH